MVHARGDEDCRCVLFFENKQSIHFFNLFLVSVYKTTGRADTWASAIGDQSRCAYEVRVKYYLSNVGASHLLCSLYFCQLPSLSLRQPLGSEAELIPQEERSWHGLYWIVVESVDIRYNGVEVAPRVIEQITFSNQY